MKRENEYIFSDDLKQKTFLQRLLYKLGFKKSRRLEEWERVIEKPTPEQLGLPTNEEINSDIEQFNSQTLFFGVARQIMVHFLNVERIDIEKEYYDNKFASIADFQILKDAINLLHVRQWILFDGECYYLTDMGRFMFKKIIDKDFQNFAHEMNITRLKNVLGVVCLYAFLAALYLMLSGCSNQPKAEKALLQAGYTEIKLGGFKWFGCNYGEVTANSFTAKAPNGNIVQGVVCSAPLMGNVIRTR